MVDQWDQFVVSEEEEEVNTEEPIAEKPKAKDQWDQYVVKDEPKIEQQEPVQENDSPFFEAGPVGAFKKGMATVRTAELGSKRRDYGLSPEELVELDSLQEKIKASPESKGWFRRLVTGESAAAMAPFSLRVAKRALEHGLGGASAGAGAAALGGITGPQAALPEEAITIPALAGSGFVVGSTYGAFAESANLEGGLAYNDLIAEGVNEDVAKPISRTIGLINGGIELLQIDEILKTIPGAKGMMRKGIKSAVTSAIKNSTIRGALSSFIPFIAKETTQEVMQEIAPIIGEEAGKGITNAIDGTDLPAATKEEIKDRLVSVAIETALAMPWMAVPGTTMTIAGKGVESSVAKHRNQMAEKYAPEMVEPTDSEELSDEEVMRGKFISAMGLDPQQAGDVAAVLDAMAGTRGKEFGISKREWYARAIEDITTDSPPEMALLQPSFHSTPHTYAPEPGFPHGRPRLDLIFSKEKVGQGAWSYGAGWYSADLKEVALGNVSPESILLDGKEITTQTKEWESIPHQTRRAIEDLWEDAGINGDGFKIDVDRAVRNQVDPYREKYADDPEELADLDRHEAEMRDVAKRFSIASSLYKLDIPDDVIPKLLDWDSVVPEGARSAVRSALEGRAGKALSDALDRPSLTGQELYHNLAFNHFGSQKSASEFLARAGIPGNKYLDQGSRVDFVGMGVVARSRIQNRINQANARGDDKFAAILQKQLDDNDARVEQSKTKTYNYVIWDQPTLDRVALLERNGEKLDAMSSESAPEAPEGSALKTLFQTAINRLQGEPTGTEAFYSNTSNLIEGLPMGTSRDIPVQRWVGVLEKIANGKTVPNIAPGTGLGARITAELEDTGFMDWLREQKGTLTRQQLIDEMQSRRVVVTETVRPNPDEYRGPNEPPEASVAYSGYRQPGESTGYREMVFSTPGTRTAEEWQTVREDRLAGTAEEELRPVQRPLYTSPHWHGIPNPIAHARADVRDVTVSRDTDAALVFNAGDSARFKAGDAPSQVEFIAENDRLISEGKIPMEADYASLGKATFLNEIQGDLPQKRRQIRKIIEMAHRGADPEALDKVMEESGLFSDFSRNRSGNVRLSYAEDMVQAGERLLETTYPKLPFVDTTSQWSGYVMRRMLRQAAEEGHDYLAWTNGEMARYAAGLGERLEIRRVMFNPSKDTGFWDVSFLNQHNEPIGNINQLASRDVLAEMLGQDVADRIVRENSGEIGGLNIPWERYEGEEARIVKGNKGFYDDMLPKIMNKYLRSRGWGEVKQVEMDMGNEGVQKVWAIEIDPLMRAEIRNQSDPTYFQSTAQAAVSFKKDGRALIHATAQSDVSSGIHEIAHVMRRWLTGEERRIAEGWAGVTDGNWTRESEEAFANGFETYVMEGKAPNSALQSVFERLKDWMVGIYQFMQTGRYYIPISDEMRGLYDKVLDERRPNPVGFTAQTTKDELSAHLRSVAESKKDFSKKAYISAADYLSEYQGDLRTADRKEIGTILGIKNYEKSHIVAKVMEEMKRLQTMPLEEAQRIENGRKNIRREVATGDGGRDAGAEKALERYADHLISNAALNKNKEFAAKAFRSTFYDIDELVGAMEYEKGVPGLHNLGQVLVESRHMQRRMWEEFEDGVAEIVGTSNIHVVTQDQIEAARIYWDTGKEGEGLDPKWKKLVDYYKKYDDDQLKSIVKANRIDRYARQGKSNGFSEDQKKYMEKFRAAWNSNDPVLYEELVHEAIVSEDSDILVIGKSGEKSNYRPMQPAQMDMDADFIEKQISESVEYDRGPAHMSPRELMRRMTPGRESENPFSAFYAHVGRQLKIYYLHKPINDLWAATSPITHRKTKESIKRKLNGMVGIASPNTPLGNTLMRGMGNAWKTVAANFSVQIKQPFQRIQASVNDPRYMRITDGALAINRELEVGKAMEANYKKEFSDPTWSYDRVKTEVLMNRSIAKELFAEALNAEMMRDVNGLFEKAGVGTLQLLTDNYIIRGLNKLLGDRASVLQVEMDKASRIANMSEWIRKGKDIIIDKKADWNTIAKEMGLTSGVFMPWHWARIAALIADGKRKEAVWEIAKHRVRVGHYNYDRKLRPLIDDAPGMRYVLQYGTWWRQFTMSWYRMTANLTGKGLEGDVLGPLEAGGESVSRQRIQALRHMANLSLLLAGGGTMWSLLTGRGEKGDDFIDGVIKTFWNQWKIGKFETSGVGNVNTLLTPIYMAMGSLEGEGPSQVIGSMRTMARGMKDAMMFLHSMRHAEKTENKAEKEEALRDAEFRFRMAIDAGDEYFNTYYWAYARATKIFDVANGVRNANWQRVAAARAGIAPYRTQLEERDLLTKVLNTVFVSNPAIPSEKRGKFSNIGR